MKKVALLLCLLGVPILSWMAYNPLHSWFFKSDQAIHVLMSLDFHLPEDAYYWGQNRLGSLLPLLSSLFVHWVPIHPILTVGLINYLFLGLCYLFLAQYLSRTFSKFVLLLVLFTPHPTYYWVLLIGHPYAAQLALLAAALYCFVAFQNSHLNSIQSPNNTQNPSHRTKALLFGFSCLMSMAIWVNEFSVLLLPACLHYLHTNGTLQRFIQKPLIAWVSMFFCFGLGLIYFLKRNAHPDPEYQHLFIISPAEIKAQFNYLKQQVLDIVLLRNHHSVLYCLFYYALIFVALKTWTNKKLNYLVLFWLSIGFGLLFFSYWNYRSHFDAKYGIPLYVAGMYWLIYELDHQPFKKQALFLGLIGLLLIAANLDFYVASRSWFEDIREAYASEEPLERGYYYGDYWDVYRAAAVLPKNQLFPISMHDWDYRNRQAFNWLGPKVPWYVSDKLLKDWNKAPIDTLNYYNEILLINTGKRFRIGSDSGFVYQAKAF